MDSTCLLKKLTLLCQGFDKGPNIQPWTIKIIFFTKTGEKVMFTEQYNYLVMQFRGYNHLMVSTNNISLENRIFYIQQVNNLSHLDKTLLKSIYIPDEIQKRGRELTIATKSRMVPQRTTVVLLLKTGLRKFLKKGEQTTGVQDNLQSKGTALFRLKSKLLWINLSFSCNELERDTCFSYLLNKIITTSLLIDKKTTSILNCKYCFKE